MTGQLAFKNAGNTGTITLQAAATAGNFTVTLPAETGTVCTTAVGGACSALGFYIQNQNAGAQTTSNFWISGTGRADTSVITPVLDTASAVALNIGSTASVINLNKNVTVAASQSLTLVGGITSTRPASPTEGMLYYDTTTKDLLVYANGKWQADRSNSTLIVGTSAIGGVSTAVASQNPDGADYVNTSTTSAQTVINAAITALPATGGSVYLMEGTYIVDGGINVPSNVMISGAGTATIIKVKSATNANLNVISGTGTKIVIQNLVIDGNKATQSGAVGMNGIYFNGVTSSMITNVTASNMYYGSGSISGGILMNSSSLNTVTDSNLISNSNAGIDFNSASNNTMSGNTIQNNGTYGIINTSAGTNTFTGNAILNNGTYGIYATSAGGHNITGNTITGNTYGIYFNAMSVDNNTVSGNTIIASQNGIYLSFSSNNTITGNNISGSSDGMYISAGSTSNNISGNNVLNSSNMGIRLEQATNNIISNNNVQTAANYGISLSINSAGSNNNIVSGNRIKNTGGALNNYGIVAAFSSNNSITGNDITDNSCTSTCYAIYIQDATSTTNYLANNHHSGSAANPSIISDAGTGTIYANQTDGSGNLINESQGGGLTVGASSANSSLTLQGGLKASALPVPVLSATVTNVGTAGATTYRYQITALDGLGETTGSTIQQTTTGNATLSGTNYNTITWAQVGGAYQYRIYRCTGAACTPALLTTVAGNTTSYNDQAPGAPSGALPVANTTGGASFSGNLLVRTNADSATAFQVQDAAGNSALVMDSTTGTLKVYENVASPTNFASISYSGGAAIFAASSGTTQIGTAAGGGNINLVLTGAADQLLATKTNTLVAAYSVNDFKFTRNLTAGAFAATGNVMTVEDLSTFGAGSSAPNVLYVNQNNTSATGNLILAQTGGSTDKFKVTTAGNATLAGGVTIGAASSYSGAGAVTLQSGAATALTITANAGSTWSTTTGNLTLLAGGASSVILKPGTDSASAIQFQNAAGTALLTADTTNGRLVVGVATAIEKLTIGGAVALQETTAPAGTTGYGKLYVNSTDHALHFVNNTGTDTALGVPVAHAKTIKLSAEYPSTVLDAASDASCASANAGSMTSGFTGTTTLINYFKWTTTNVAAQCYDLVIHVQVPSDFSSWSGVPTIAAYSSDGVAAINVETRDTAGAVGGNNYTAVSPGTATWTTVNLNALSGTYTPGSTMSWRIRLTSTNNNYAQVGDITLNYNSTY